MKLATLKNHTRDGQLVVVDRQLMHALPVPEIAQTLQQALDNWSVLAPKLRTVYEALQHDRLSSAQRAVLQKFDVKLCASPLPRAYQWADGSAYVRHVELVRKARGAELPDSFWTDPLMYQGGSDAFLGPCEDIAVADEAWGIDFEAEVAVITDDVPMGVTAQEARQHIQLFMLVNDVSLRNLIPQELAKGFGFFQSKPASAFSPVVVTPDELEDAWDGAKLHLPLKSYLNEQLFGEPNAGVDMTFDFPTLIAHAAKTRELCAGSIIGSGTVSNLSQAVGSSCIAERRMLETLQEGQPRTPFMRFGDRIKIEMCDKKGRSIFGAIDQQVVPHRRS